MSAINNISITRLKSSYVIDYPPFTSKSKDYLSILNGYYFNIRV